MVKHVASFCQNQSDLPEVVKKLCKCVHSARQRDYNVDYGSGCVHRCAPHFHQGPKGTEQSHMPETARVLFSKKQFIQRAFVSLCSVQSCR